MVYPIYEIYNICSICGDKIRDPARNAPPALEQFDPKRAICFNCAFKLIRQQGGLYL